VDLNLSKPDRSAGSVLSRRQFLQLTTIAGSGLTLGFVVQAAGNSGSDGSTTERTFVSPFIRITPDNRVIVISKHLELGQGIHTGLCAIVAEELDASWDQIEVENAPVQVPLYANLLMDPEGRMQVTGGSMSLASSWEQLRRAGAAVRAMLVRAAANHWNIPVDEVTASDGALSHAASGRSASFGEFAALAAMLPVPDAVKLKDPGDFKLIGKGAFTRVDGPAKSTGRERYGIDVMLPNLMTAIVARSPRFGGKVKSFNKEVVVAMPGVVDVVEIPNGVAVLARSTWQAMRGRAALVVDWDDSGAEKRSSAEMFEEYRHLAAGKSAATVAETGEVEAAMSRCSRKYSAEFEFPYLAHAMMEPLNAVVQLSTKRCEIWTGSQFPSNDRLAAAVAAGLEPEQVVINTLAAGGSFGRRGSPDYIVEAVSVAKATGGKFPVRLLWTREDDIRMSRYRPMNYHRIRAGIDNSGALLAFQQRIVGQSLLAGTPLDWMIQHGVDPTAVSGHALEQYEVANAEVTWTRASTGVPVQFWRSVQHSHTAFSAEVAIDELAELAGRDPLAFRQSMLGGRERHLEVLRLVAEKSHWNEPLKGSDGPRGRGLALHEAFGTVVAEVAEVTVKDDAVRVDRVVCVVDCGLAVTPDIVRVQMESGIVYGLSAALSGRITFTGGAVDQSNFGDYPVLRMPDMPRIEVHVVPSANAPSGVGEPGTPPIAPAVANAVRAATGIRIRRLPIDLTSAREA
jgi:isoquinoline 1-oxidoreductase beta subunit